MTSMMRTYTELIQIQTFEDRIKYLMTHSQVGGETFGCQRYLNQKFYRADREWKRIRDYVIVEPYSSLKAKNNG